MQRRQLLAGLPCWAVMLQAMAQPQPALPQAAASASQAAAWASDLPEARLLGEGDFTWFGLRVYHAQLWVGPDWPVQADAAQPQNWQAQSLVLQLQYARAIERAQFVDATMQEIARLQGPDFSPLRRSDWSTALTAMWRDVQPGDVLSAFYAPQRGCRFYDQQALLGELAEPEFAKAFMAIWLHPQSRDRSLRRQLLGLA